ncbi:MAG TPA: nucleotidyltransferase family protein [Tepidisphaeraceae bacterium]|nr:nucleotidyltransferase family protein [Tepidisphaeraceae bacterium]
MSDRAIGKIAIVVLAAGRSARLGRDKRLLMVDGEPLIRRACQLAVACAVGPVFVITGANDFAAAEAIADLPVIVLSNPTPEAGIGSSIRVGIAAAAAGDAEAAIITVCDQLSVTTKHLLHLVQAAGESRAAAVASRYAGDAGVPALFTRPMFPALCAIPPDEGAQRLLRSLGGGLHAVDLPDGEQDIDLPADLVGLARNPPVPPPVPRHERAG